MYSELVYTDHTTLCNGKYKFYKLHEVPVDYLINIYENLKGSTDKALAAYVEKNIDRIKARKEGLPFIVEPIVEKEVCTKKYYPTKGEARKALKIIRESQGDHKKPIRSYECEKCSGWHHTSLTIEEWKQKINT